MLELSNHKTDSVKKLTIRLFLTTLSLKNQGAITILNFPLTISVILGIENALYS